MLARTVVCSEKDHDDISFRQEELLVVIYKDNLFFERGLPGPFLFFAGYSEKHKVRVLLTANVFWKGIRQFVFVIEDGKTVCIAGSAEEGAEHRTVFDGMGLCVGDDFKDPLGLNLLSAGVKIVVATTTKKADKESVRAMYAYKNICPVPAIVGFSDGYYLVDKKIFCLENGKCARIEESVERPPVKKGYLTVRTVCSRFDFQ